MRMSLQGVVLRRSLFSCVWFSRSCVSPACMTRRFVAVVAVAVAFCCLLLLMMMIFHLGRDVCVLPLLCFLCCSLFCRNLDWARTARLGSRPEEVQLRDAGWAGEPSQWPMKKSIRARLTRLSPLSHFDRTFFHQARLLYILLERL